MSPPSIVLAQARTSDRTIYVTAADMRRLRALVTNQKNSRDDLRALSAELDRARVVAPAEIPADVITMNSKARLRELLTDDVVTYTLVFFDHPLRGDGAGGPGTPYSARNRDRLWAPTRAGPFRILREHVG